MGEIRCGRQGKTVQYRCDLFDYFERTHVPWTEFFAGQMESEVIGGEPDPLARVIFWVSLMMAIGMFLLSSERSLEMNVGLVPGCRTLPIGTK